MRTVLDRTGAPRAPLPRPASPRGRTVGLLDIGEAGGGAVLDRPAELLRGDGVTMRRHREPTFARTAPVDLRHEITAQFEVVIEALADQGLVHDVQ